MVTSKQVIAPSALEFYRQVIALLQEQDIRFMVGGGVALLKHANIDRLKDLDIFCTPGDYPRILSLLQASGIETVVHDASWLAQAIQGKHNIDFVFSSPNGLTPVDDTWFEHARSVEIFGTTVQLVPPEEVIWSKAYIQEHDRFDGADINHILLHLGHELDWPRLLLRLEAHWELLLAVLINFRFVYPGEREVVPAWLMNELLSRLQHQLETPIPRHRTCRGPLLSRSDYDVDIQEHGYKP